MSLVLSRAVEALLLSEWPEGQALAQHVQDDSQLDPLEYSFGVECWGSSRNW